MVCVLILTIVFLFSKCNYRNNDKNIKQYKTIVSSTWEELGIPVIDTLVIKEKNLYYLVIFKDNYHLQQETNFLLYSYLFYRLDTLMNDIDSVKIAHRYKGLQGINYFFFSRKEIMIKQLLLKYNELFRNSFVYIINNCNTEDILLYNNLIEFLRKEDPDLFEKDESFWSFLFKYTQCPCDKKSIEFQSMDLFLFMVSNSKHPFKTKAITKVIEMSQKECI